MPQAGWSHYVGRRRRALIPQADRKAARSKGTFAEWSKQYVEQYPRRENKSWVQADKLCGERRRADGGAVHGRSTSPQSDVRVVRHSLDRHPVVAKRHWRRRRRSARGLSERRSSGIDDRARGVQRKRHEDPRTHSVRHELTQVLERVRPSGLLQSTASKVYSAVRGNVPVKSAPCALAHRGRLVDAARCPGHGLKWPGTQRTPRAIGCGYQCRARVAG